MLLSLATLPAVALFFTGTAPVRPATSITNIVNGATTYLSSQSVHIWRGEAAQMEVFGSVVATALGVDVFLSDGNTPAPLMVGSIVTRKPSSVVIRVDVAAVVTRATYIVRLRYAAAVGDPDEFKVRVYDRGSITAISVDDQSPRAGETVTFTVTGQNLEKAKLDLSQVGQSPASYTVKSRSATSLTFTITFGVVGSTSISSWHFFDEDIGSSLGTLAGGYSGSTSRLLDVTPNPVITSVSPAATVGGGTVTISGSGLNPSGWTPKIRVGHNFTSTVELAVTVVNGSTLQFQSGVSSNYQDLHLIYRRNDGGGTVSYTSLPHQVLAQFTPVIQRAGHVLDGSGPADCGVSTCPSGTDTRVYYLRQGYPNEMQGLWLQPAPNTPLVVKHGSNTLNATYVSHNTVVFEVPAGAAAASGPITVQTGGGTGTSPRVAYFAPAPSGLKLHKPDGTGASSPSVPVTDGKLQRDTWYRVVGNNLHIIPYQAEPAHVSDKVAPEVYQYPAQPFETSIGPGWTNFRLPANHPVGSATLTYKHWGGSATIGTFQVVAEPADVTAMQVSSANVAWYSNATVQGTVADRTIPSGTARTLSVTVQHLSSGVVPTLAVTSSDPAVSVGGPYTFTPSSVVYNPNVIIPISPTVSVPIQVQPVAAARTVTLTFKAGDNAGAMAVVPITLAPVPLPKLESVAFEPTTMTGGTHAKVRIVLSAPPPVTMSLPVSTKDGVQVPPAVSLSAKETVFQVQTPVVTQMTPVVVSVGAGADLRSATLTLHPMINVQSLVPEASPIPSGRITNGTLTLDHAAWETTLVTLTSSNPALLTVPTSVTLRPRDRTVNVPLTAAAGVTTVISVNVEARIGTRVHTATIRVGPGM